MLERVGCPKKPIVQCVYVSDQVGGLNRDALRRLGEICIKNNATDGLTGVLFCNGHRFLGFLEGPATQLLTRMELIAGDPRHSNLRILLERDVVERRCKNWFMADFQGAGDAALEVLDGVLAPHLTQGLSAAAGAVGAMGASQ